MQLTKLRAAPVLRAEVPPCAPAGETDGGTASQLIRSVRRTPIGRHEETEQCRTEGWPRDEVLASGCYLDHWRGSPPLRSLSVAGPSHPPVDGRRRVLEHRRPIRERQVLFWALLTGVLALLLGQLALWVSRRGRALPAFLGWQVLALTLVCGVLMPVSGGWLLAVPGVLIILDARQEQKAIAP
jgi:hypothetical protein